MEFGPYMYICKVSQVYSNKDCNGQFSSTYANELLGNSVICIFTMYYYIPLYDILVLTSFKSLHRFAANFVSMFDGWTPTTIFNN